MNGLILLCVGLVALVGALCTMIYSRLMHIENNASLRQGQLNRVEIQLHELVQTQLVIQSRLEQLAADVLHREIYQGSDDRHQLAIKAAKDGQSLSQLIQVHGLSSDEAALIISLHGGNLVDISKKEQLTDTI